MDGDVAGAAKLSMNENSVPDGARQNPLPYQQDRIARARYIIKYFINY